MSGEPVKRHIARVELDLELIGNRTAQAARVVGEETVVRAMQQREIDDPLGAKMLGRPNAKRATVAPEEEA